MILKLQQGRTKCLLSMLVLVLSACGGGGEGDGVDGVTPKPDGGNDSSETTLVALSSLGPVLGRLYPAGSNRQLLTGPVIGADLTPTSELLREIPFEVIAPIDEIAVEKTYVMREQDTERFSGTVSVNENRAPSHYMVTILTNVSNRMICDIRIRNAQFEATDGEISTTTSSILFGYMARNPATDHYEQDCIPPGLSAYAMEFFSEPEVFENDFNAGDPGKFVIGEIVGPIRDSYEPFNGLYASSYVEDSNEFHSHRYSVNMVNPANRNFDQRIVQEGIVLIMDSATGLPLARQEFSAHDDRPASFDVFTPGAEDLFQFVDGSLYPGFTGSSNTIFVWIDHIEEGNEF